MNTVKTGYKGHDCKQLLLLYANLMFQINQILRKSSKQFQSFHLDFPGMILANNLESRFFEMNIRRNITMDI